MEYRSNARGILIIYGIFFWKKRDSVWFLHLQKDFESFFDFRTLRAIQWLYRCGGEAITLKSKVASEVINQ